MSKRWTIEENEFLMRNYETKNNTYLLDNLPNRTWESIKLKASSLKLKRYYNDNRLASLDILLNESNETYYWIGFIMADGNVKNNRLRIRISSKDVKHLLKFKKYISFDNDLFYSKDNTHVGISVMDSKFIKMLCDKFDIKENKTYNPCNINNINSDEKLLSLIIGFIDGDGSITYQFKRKDFSLRIKCHKSWYENLDYILNSITRITGEPCKTSVKLVDDDKYACISITNTKTLKKLKNEMSLLNVPYLTRKWDIIDINYKSFYEKSYENRELFKKLYRKDIKVKYLAETMNCSVNVIYKYKKIYNL